MQPRFKFKQIKGDPEKPFGLAGFYVPIVSHTGNHFLAIGGDCSKINPLDYRLDLEIFLPIMQKCRRCIDSKQFSFFGVAGLIGADAEELSGYFPGDFFKTDSMFKMSHPYIRKKLLPLIELEVKSYYENYIEKNKLCLGPIPENPDMSDLWTRIDSGKFD